jgi:hypothetical protein
MTDKLSKQHQLEVKKEVDKQVNEKLGQREKELEKKIEKKVYRSVISKSKQKAVFFGMKFKNHLSTALIAAFGLVMALSWQTVIKKVIEDIPKSDILSQHPYLADLYTAIAVTFIAVLAILLISKWANKE